MEEVKGQTLLGSEGFVEWVREKFLKVCEGEQGEVAGLRSLLPEKSVGELAKAVGKEYGIDPNELLTRRSKWREARQFLIEISCKMGAKTRSLKELAREFGGVSVSALTYSKKRLAEKAREDHILADRLRRIEKALGSP